MLRIKFIILFFGLFIFNGCSKFIVPTPWGWALVEESGGGIYQNGDGKYYPPTYETI